MRMGEWNLIIVATLLKMVGLIHKVHHPSSLATKKKKTPAQLMSEDFQPVRYKEEVRAFRRVHFTLD